MEGLRARDNGKHVLVVVLVEGGDAAGASHPQVDRLGRASKSFLCPQQSGVYVFLKRSKRQGVIKHRCWEYLRHLRWRVAGIS